MLAAGTGCVVQEGPYLVPTYHSAVISKVLNGKNVFHSITIIVAVLVMGFGLSVSLRNAKLTSEIAILKSSLERPYLLRNFEFTVLPYLKPLSSSLQSTGVDADRKLLFVARNSCGFCSSQLPWWRRMVEAPSAQEQSEVWLISIGSGELFADLVAYLGKAGRRYRQFTALSPEVFALGSGIQAVPTTIVTRGDRVVLVHSGVFTDEVWEAVTSILDASHHDSVRFLPPGQRVPSLPVRQAIQGTLH
jgi:hypothetical protein